MAIIIVAAAAVWVVAHDPPALEEPVPNIAPHKKMYHFLARRIDGQMIDTVVTECGVKYGWYVYVGAELDNKVALSQFTVDWTDCTPLTLPKPSNPDEIIKINFMDFVRP